MFAIAAKKKTTLTELRAAGVGLRRSAEQFDELFVVLRIHGHDGDPGPDGMAVTIAKEPKAIGAQVIACGPREFEKGLTSMIFGALSNTCAITPVWDVIGIDTHGCTISVAANVTENEDRWLTNDEDCANRERVRVMLEPCPLRAKELATQACHEFAEGLKEDYARMRRALSDEGVFLSRPRGEA